MKKALKYFCVLIMAAVVAVCAGCGGLLGRQYSSTAYFAAQTLVVVYDDFGAEGREASYLRCIDEIEKAFGNIEAELSHAVPGSSVARFNDAPAGTVVEIGRIAYDVMVIAQEMCAYTNGAYDPAAGLLVDLWGFSPRFDESGYTPREDYDRADPYSELPAAEYINAFKMLTGFGSTELYESDGKYYIKKPDTSVTVGGKEYSMRIDLGGIGKGYAADVAADILKSCGYEYGYVSLGNSSLSLFNCYTGAHSPNWSVDVASPDGGKYAEIYASGICVSTSGQYYRSYEIDGVRYSHIIDCKTGYPTASGIESLTLLTQTAAKGDALSTALCVMSRPEAEKFIADNGLQSMFISADGNGYKVTTSLDGGNYKITDGRYRVA